ncbi:MAG TPA: phosphoenolpyruvate--protein phosphotransferase, partial [Planctomycetota bacterium]|nr:phosphoenolpyruvate--protein phosphotransferase [Planctomycetota bacterium]
RGSDIQDLQKRLLKVLLGGRTLGLSALSKPVAVIARDLGPSQTAAFDRNVVKAFAIDVGGKTSHTAILARAFEMPAVVGLETVSSDISGGETLIIDGNRGIVVIRPDERTLARYRKRQEEIRSHEQALIQEKDLPAVTRDGREIRVMGNIEFPEEVQGAVEHGAGGIGLFRTEFLYLKTGLEPDETAHFQAYQQCLWRLNGRPLVIRTQDLGADKILHSHVTHEQNPYLGLRSIRVSMKYPETFRVQVRAILRASALGKVRMMVPMITNIEELRWVRRIVEETKQDLRKEGQAFDEKIEVGIMVEVPSAALQAHVMAKECDFFSIGTNDLTQYTLAVDRGNELVANLYNAANPAVLNLIKVTVDAANTAKIPVSMCGEMAGDPLFAPLLVGMGMTEISISPPSIPEIKKAIRGVSFEDCKKVMSDVMAMTETDAIVGFLRERLPKESQNGSEYA